MTVENRGVGKTPNKKNIVSQSKFFNTPVGRHILFWQFSCLCLFHTKDKKSIEEYLFLLGYIYIVMCHDYLIVYVVL